MQRSLMPLLLLVSCARASSQPERLTVRNEMLNSVEFTARLDELREPKLRLPGCKVMAKGADIILQCPENEMFLRFSCRDHWGPDHQLSVLIGAAGYALHCH